MWSARFHLALIVVLFQRYISHFQVWSGEGESELHNDLFNGESPISYGKLYADGATLEL